MKKKSVKGNKYRKFKNPRIPYTLNKTFVLSLFVISVAVKTKKYLKNKNQSRY